MKLNRIRATKRPHEYRVYSDDSATYFGLVFSENDSRRWVSRPPQVFDDSQDTIGFSNKSQAAKHLVSRGGVGMVSTQGTIRSDGNGRAQVLEDRLTRDEETA